MSTLNEGINRIRELLLSPKEQKPSIKLLFGNLLREQQNIYNELSNSSAYWTTKETTVTLNSETDYLVNGEIGKVLFVTANSGDYAYPVEFTDLADASTDWWFENPYATARPEEYNGFGNRIAFYRKDGSLYVKAPYGWTDSLTIYSATGNWTQGVNANTRPVLSEYEHLAQIRAAKNLTVEARWSDDAVQDERKADRLMVSLADQEARVYQQFIYAKRSMTADSVAWIGSNDWYF